MTADEARQRADTVNSTRDKTQYAEIKKIIGHAVDDGKYGCAIYNTEIRREVRAKLVKEGYTLSGPRSGGPNETVVDVYWDHQKAKE